MIAGWRRAGAPLFAGALFLLAALPAACARALRDPRPIADLAGAPPPADAAGIKTLMTEAESLYATREVAKVEDAARLYLRAAAAEGAPVEAFIGAARAEVWLTDHATDAGARQSAAAAAVEAAQWCARKAPSEAACDYWLGAGLGVQARERTSTGLSALPEIERAFQSALDRIPTYDDAGPDRALALLYLRAPGWPAGPGDPALGLQHARAAVARSPDYPPNQLALAEALGATGDADGGRRACGRALELARQRAAAGDPDAAEWVAEASRRAAGG